MARRRTCADCRIGTRPPHDPLIRVSLKPEVWKHLGCATVEELRAFVRPGRVAMVERTET
jgi:hypothetical protein